MDVAQWIDEVALRLRRSGAHFGHGTDCAEDEAAWLVLHAMGLDFDPGVACGALEVGSAQAQAIESLARERIDRGVPLAYLVGRTRFAGLEFEVDDSVLVPRSPIAELITEQFAPWRRPRDVHRVLDLCTGSGCIAVAIAVHMPWVQVDASDISAAALRVARRNVARHGVADRVTLHLCDLFQELQGRRYDLIVTNPPYVPAARLSGLPREYRAEPELGLISGRDGLDACLAIMFQSALHLEDQGILVCEVGESQERLAEMFPTVPFVWLEFSQGGSGVFVLEREDLIRARPAVERCIKERTDV